MDGHVVFIGMVGLGAVLGGGVGCELGEPVETAPSFEPDLVLVSDQTPDDLNTSSVEPQDNHPAEQERSAVLSGINLVANSGFEFGISSWSAPFGGTLAIATDQAYRGSQSGIVTNRTETYQGAHCTVTDWIERDAVYDVRAFVKISGAATDSVILTGLTQCQGEDSQFVTIASGVGRQDRWTDLHGQFQVFGADSCEVTLVRLYVEGPGAGVDLYVDDLEVVKL